MQTQLDSILAKRLTPDQLAHAGFELRILDRKSGRTLCAAAHRDTVNFYPASTIKTLIAVAALREVDAGRLKMDRSFKITQPNAAAECKEWDCAVYGPEKSVTVAKLMEDMMAVSNNIAANQLMDIVTKAEINKTADDLGLPELRVFRKVYGEVPAEPNEARRNTGTPKAFADLYQEIATGRRKMLRKKSREYLIALLGRNRQNDRLNAHFPKGETFRHKTGDTSQVAADMGFFYFGKKRSRIAIVVGMQEFRSFETLANIGEDIYALIQGIK